MRTNLRKPERNFYVLVLLSILSQANAEFEGKKFKRENDLREYLDYLTTSIDDLKKQVEEQGSEMESLKELNAKLTQQGIESEERATQMSETFLQLLNETQYQMYDLKKQFQEHASENKCLEELNSKLTQQESKFEQRSIEMSQIFLQLVNETEHRVTNSRTQLKETLEDDILEAISKSEKRSNSKIDLVDLKIKKSDLSLRNLEVENERQLGQLFSAVEGVDLVQGRFNSTLIKLEVQIKNQASTLASHVNFTTTSVNGIPQQISSILPLQSAVSQLNGNQTLYKADLDDLRGRLSRGSEVIDFGNCLRSEECCKNLSDLDDISGSIDTQGTCVIAYKNSNCRGKSHTYGPQTSPSHLNMMLDDFEDDVSSVKLC